MGVSAGIPINAGAYTTPPSPFAMPWLASQFMELHLSNTHAREEFRHHRFWRNAVGVICVSPPATSLPNGLLSHLRRNP